MYSFLSEVLYSVRIPTCVGTRVGSSSNAIEHGEGSAEVYRVLATDADEGANAEINYSIMDDTKGSRFRIQPQTGVISVKRELVEGERYDIMVNARMKEMLNNPYH